MTRIHFRLRAILAVAGTVALAVGSPRLLAQDVTGSALPEAPAAQVSSSSVTGSQTPEQAQANPVPAAADPATKHNRQQQGRIFGIVPNFATVSAGARPARPGWGTDWKLANRQALDYSSFGYLLLSSGTAYAEDAHPSLDTYHGGDAIFWGYLWRGFLDKTDGVYQGTFLFPALLHEDTRYYAMGEGTLKRRTLHAVSSIVIARNYSGRSIPNVAGLAGRAGTQAVSTLYYPPGSEGFGELAEKFTYSCLRQAGINVLREFSPDLNALIHHHRHADDAQ